MTIWLVMLAAGIITYLIRLSLIATVSRYAIPPRLRQALRFVPPAVLSAIISPELFRHAGYLDLSLGNERLLAGLAAVLVAWRTRSVVWTLLAGMAALYLFRMI
jgi:branched-subunit amino acid transport protein